MNLWEKREETNLALDGLENWNWDLEKEKLVDLTDSHVTRCEFHRPVMENYRQKDFNLKQQVKMCIQWQERKKGKNNLNKKLTWSRKRKIFHSRKGRPTVKNKGGNKKEQRNKMTKRIL